MGIIEAIIIGFALYIGLISIAGALNVVAIGIEEGSKAIADALYEEID
jgi:hypothetical protein